MKRYCDNCLKLTYCKPVIIDGFPYCYCNDCKKIILIKLKAIAKTKD